MQAATSSGCQQERRFDWIPSVAQLTREEIDALLHGGEEEEKEAQDEEELAAAEGEEERED